MKIREIGLTLIELLVVLALVAVLATLAVPSFHGLLVNRTVQAAVDAFISDTRYARSEAVKRSTQVTMCKSANGTSCITGSNSWVNGWIVFIDSDLDGSVDSGEEIMKVQQALTSMASIDSTMQTSVTYQATGWAKSIGQTLIFTPSGTVPPGSIRVVCISMQGRVALKAAGATACS